MSFSLSLHIRIYLYLVLVFFFSILLEVPIGKLTSFSKSIPTRTIFLVHYFFTFVHIRLCEMGTSCQCCSQRLFWRSTGNIVSGQHFQHYHCFFFLSPKLWPFKGPWQPFLILQAMCWCRQCIGAGSVLVQAVCWCRLCPHYH